MASAQVSDPSQACSTGDTTSGGLIPLQGTQNRLSAQHHPATRFEAQATSPVNPMHTLVGALDSTQYCSSASNVGKCIVNLTTSQSPLVLSSNNNVYASPPSSVLSSSTQPQITLQSLINSLTLLLGMPSVSRTSYPPKPATIKSEKPFYITRLNNRIKKCSGCGHLFREAGTIAPDFVLGHLERDWYPAEGS